jgi:hypothetical protein
MKIIGVTLLSILCFLSFSSHKISDKKEYYPKLPYYCISLLQEFPNITEGRKSEL